VVRYAEPKGIVSPDRPYDRRPLVRPRGIRNVNQPKIPVQPVSGVRFGDRTKRAADAAEAAAEVAAGNGAPAAQAAGNGAAAPPEAERPKSRMTLGTVRKNEAAAPPAAAETPAADRTHTLEVSRGADSLKVVPLAKDSFAIGRGGDGVEVDLELDGDDAVSGLHALLERDESGFWLTAKGESPVRVNGRAVPLNRSVGVVVSDQIEIGGFNLRLQ
jgi:hypothetical protein